MMPQLCLGTAQFGLAYGITNTAGQVPQADVAQILAEAEDSDIRWLDTAQGYGVAEEVLGRSLPVGHNLKLISKLPAQSQLEFSALDTDLWEKSFRASCSFLGVESLDGFLLHRPEDLLKPGGRYLENWLLGLRQRGLVQRLGASIYSANDLDGLNPALLNLVQLPLSLYDQRLIADGTIAELHSRGIAIHARSLYLQGLILVPAKEWPRWVPLSVRNHHNVLEDAAQRHKCNLIDLALSFAKAQEALEAVVVGICNISELDSLRHAWISARPELEINWGRWAINSSCMLDPRRWPL